MKVTAPIYLLQNCASCWQCGAVQPVVALACAQWQDEEYEQSSMENENEPALLSYVTDMPLEWLNRIRQVRDGFELRHSFTADSAYYVNTCKCGAFFDDFYLHKPGEAFFPMTEAEARLIQIEASSLNGSFAIECEYSIGI